jgi:CheY-like chemotaxis protein/nitrogen-specific signal transduction histidine kinase
MLTSEREIELENRIAQLETEIKKLRNQQFYTEKNVIKAFSEVLPIAEKAQKTVAAYFSNMMVDPSRALIEIEDQRYILMRASSLSVGFFNAIQELYKEHGEEEAFRIGQNFLFDIAHVIGMEDASNFLEKMNLLTFMDKLAAGPAHFAYSGWAYVEILPISNPVPGEDFILYYNHPYSFEADSWIKSGKISDKPVCIMNSGYSSGWCEKSAEHPLTSVEISCRACGDETCAFIMAPPHRINEYLEKYKKESIRIKNYDIPSFFIRKEVEEKIKKAKEKAEASDKAKTEFLANMSHEIRTPLNTIMGYTELLKKEFEVENREEYLLNIYKSTEHLIKIVNDILELSKIEAGQLLIIPEKLNIRNFFNKLAKDCSILAGENNHSIRFEFNIADEISDFIQADNTRLQQIFYNLISNAIKFTEKGSIVINAEFYNQGKELIFSVKDSGIGIDSTKHDEIFEIFRQGDSSISRKYGGSGLGLSICKKIVNLMGGEIWLKSAPGEGTVFFFTIPFVETSENLAVENLQELKPLQNNKYKILIAEDNLMNLKLLEIILRKGGHEVISVVDGFELIKSYAVNSDIDVIITDLQMPGMSGFEAVKTIREMKGSAAKVPIIALTAHAMQEDMEKAIEVGCDAYLTKPVSFIDLFSKLAEIFNKNS